MDNVYRLYRCRGVYDSDARCISSADAVLVQGDKICEIGDYETLIQTGIQAEVIDLCNNYLFPGLINTHVHLEFDATSEARLHHIQSSPSARAILASQCAQKLLFSGVTTARDAGSTWQLLEFKDASIRNMIDLPHLQFAGPPITVTGGHLHFLGEEVDGITQMVRQVRLLQKRGSDVIKLIVTGGQMTPGSVAERVSLKTDEIKAIVDESHLLGLKTFAHCLTTEGFVRCMDGDVDCMEHLACFVRNQENNLLERIYEEDVMEKYRGQNRFFMMGLAAGYHNLDHYRSGKIQAGSNEVFWLKQEERMFEIFKKCIDLGLTPVCGTDAGTGGTYFDETWLELALMVERGGLTAVQAIDTATVDAARCLGIGDKTGKIQCGYQADMIALRQNPLEHIRAFSQIDSVVCAGKLMERSR